MSMALTYWVSLEDQISPDEICRSFMLLKHSGTRCIFHVGIVHYNIPLQIIRVCKVSAHGFANQSAKAYLIERTQEDICRREDDQMLLGHSKRTWIKAARSSSHIDILTQQ